MPFRINQQTSPRREDEECSFIGSFGTYLGFCGRLHCLLSDVRPSPAKARSHGRPPGTWLHLDRRLLGMVGGTLCLEFRILDQSQGGQDLGATPMGTEGTELGLSARLLEIDQEQA
jgi:hypothetical protein